VAAVVLVDTAFFAALSPLLPQYAAMLGLTKTMAGILAGAFGAGVLVAAIPSGLIAGRLGVRATLLVGLAVTAITSLAFGLGHGLGVLLVARFVSGIGSACSWTAAIGWLARTVPPERRGELIGTALSAAVGGALLGPVLGGAAAWAGTGVAFGAMALAFVGLAIRVAMLSDPGGKETSVTVVRALAEPRVRASLGLILLAPLLFGALGVLVPLRLAGLGWDPGRLGALFMAAAALEGVAHPLVGRWADRRGPLAALSAGLMGSIVALIGLAWAGNAANLAGLVVLASVTFGATFVPAAALLIRIADAAGFGSVLPVALMNFAWALGHAVGAPGSGWLADRAGETVTYLGLAALCALILLGVRHGAARFTVEAWPRP